MATVTGDITQITDEDLLRRMWQQAEDFSRKKEIRAHMYKIREQRLKDFYTSGEVLRDVQRSNSSPGLREGTPTDGIGKSNTTQSYTKTTQYTRGGESGLTHADSLTDQSFLSLKSKEIRDSESPTRDISYRTQDIVRQGDHDWKILTSKETSEDGKSHLESLIATTAGTREIDGGTNKFAALKEESKFEKNDGDENNFSRTVGGSSKSVAQEHFVSGDDNNYRTSSSKTTSSSSHVVKHFSTKSDEPQITYDRESNFGDDYDERKSTREESRTNYSTNRQVIDNSETDNLYRKNNRYQDESYTNRNDSSNYRQYKQDTSETNRKIIDTNTSQFQHDTTTDKTVEKDGTVVQRVVKIYKSNDPNLPEYAKTNIVDGTTKIVTETRTMPDGSSVTKTKYETVGSKASSDISCAQSNKTSENRRHTEERTSKKYDSRDTTSSRSNKEIDEKTSRKYQQNENDLIDNNIKSTVRITRTQYEDEVDDRSTRNNLRKSDETSTIDNVQIKTSVQSHHIDNTSSNDQNTEFINVERTVDHRKSPDKYTSSKREPESSPPGDETKVSKEHYKTTYQQEFTNKKISVEVSPQHDAFARSLRTTPDRTSPNRSTKSPSRQDRYGSSDTFTRSQTDITTTRRTASPQKDSRTSPTRKPSSKESSPSYRQSPDRKPDRYRESPERSMYPSRINEQKTVTSETKRYIKTSKTSPSPERKEDSPRESIYTTDYCTDTIKKRKQITDRESPDRTRKSPRSESPLKYSRDKISPAKSPAKSRSSPTKDFPSKTPSSRESSPNTDTFTRPRKASPSKETRESSPNTDTFTRPRKTSPSKDFSKEPSPNTDTFTRRGKSSPTKEQPKESSPNTDTFTRPRKSSPSKNDKNSEPKNYRPQPDADEDDIGIKTIKSSRNTEVTQETVTTTVDTKRRTSGGILKNTKRSSEDKPEPEPYQEATIITTDINYVLPNTQIITDLDSNETITITIQPEERPSTLNLEETNYINELIQNERNIEIRNQTTAYSPEPKPIPGKDALISPNPDESAPCEFLVSPKEPEPKSSSPVSPKKDRPLRRKDTYADKCAELLGLVSTKKDSTEIVETSKTTKTKVENTTDFITNEKQNIEKTTSEKEVQRQSPKTSPERKSPSKKSPSKEVPDKSNKGPEVQEFPAQRRSPTSSPERKSPSKTPDISKKSPIKEVPDKTTKGPTVQEFPAQRRSPTSSPERKSPSKTPDVSKKSPSREFPDKSSKGSIQEFPAQRRSPTSSPERKSPSKTLDVSKKSPSPDKGPTVQEFPAQRRSPTSSPERKTSRNIPDDKISPNANKQPNEPYKKTNLQEFPAQKRSPESSPDRKTSTNQEINVTTTNITRKSSLKKPKDTNEAAPTNKQYPTRPYDTSPDRKTSEYSSCDETTVVNRKSSLKKTKIQDTVRKSPTKETPNARQTPDSSPDRQSPRKSSENDTSPQRKSSLKKPKTSVTEFILNEQMIIEQNSKEAAKKIYKSEDITDESDTDSDNEGGDISESESYKYIKNIESEYFPENGIETVLTTKQTTDFNETDFITATVTTETVTNKIDKEIKRPSTPSKIPTKKTPDSSPDRKTNRKTPTNATSPDRKTTTYNLIRNERIQSKQSPESSPDRKTTKKIPVKSPQTTEKKTPATKPLTKQSSNKEIPARSAQPSPDRKTHPSPDRKPVSKTPSRSSIKTPEQPVSGKSSPTKFSKSPSDTKRPSISSPTPKATSVSPKTTKTTQSKPLPRRHTDESLTGKTPAKSQPKTKGTVRTVTSTKITKTTSVSPVLKKTMSNIDNKPKKKQPNKATTETESENEEYSDIELNEDGSLITNVSILDAEEFTNDTTTVQNHKTVISETKTYTSDLKINRNGSQKSPVTIKIKPEENTTSKRPSTPSNKIPVRKTPLNKKKPDIKIATKTITLTDTNTEQIVIDIQQSKSSREPSSEHVWPCPVPNDTDTGKPRYPDNVCEPDDQNTKKFKVTDIPLTEGEDVDFNQSKITDVTDEYPENYIPKSIRITDVDKVQETDESLLSVSDKVSKFLHTAEKLTKTSKKDTSTPAPKVTRPELIIDDETLISDECLLSVSDKVNKFLTTAEQLTTTTLTSTERPKSPRCRNYEDNEENYIVDETDECLLSVTDKVNRFTTTVEQVASNKRSSDSKPAPKVERPDIIDVNEELREDECLLSVSDKVNKFLTTAEQLTTTTTTKTTSSTQKETEPKYKPPEKESTTMRQEPKRQSPIRRPPLVTESEVTTKTTTLTKQLPNENESPKKIYETPKAPRSSEAVRKAKAIFENINNTQQENVNKRNVKTWETKKVSTKDESTKLTDIGVYKKQVDDKKDEVVSMRKESLPKTEITVQRKESLPKTEITSQRKESLSKTTKNIQEDTSLKSTKLILNKPSSTVPTSLDEKPESPVEKYKKLISSKNEVNDYKRPVTPKFETKRPSSPQKPQVNGTVKEDIEITKKKHTPIQETKPRQRSISPLKDTTPRKSIEEPVITKKEISQLEEVSTTKQTKFGVVLKRTDSGRTITTTEQRRRSMSTDPKDPNHQPCIEDIEDLCLLEQMLEKVSGYEQRRRIRAQIRVVKKLIQEGKISSSTTTKRTTVSPIRKSPERKILTSKVENTPRQESTEYNEKSYMRQTLTSEKKVNKVTDEDVLQGSTTRTSIDNTTTNFNKKMRSPSPKQRSPSPQYRTPKVTDYSQPTAAWTSRTTTSTTTNIIKKARSPSPKQRSPSPSQQNRPSKVTDYSQPTAAWSLKSTNSRTDFKKIVPKQKPQTDEQPEWVTQKILRKVDRNNTQTTTQTNQRRVTTLSELKSKKDVPKEYESSPSTKDIEPTECITSSYGVGPTDEIGRPLFGLKALRHQSSFNEKTQVRGTVVSSSYYSENGSEPVGEVTVTQYSSDPNELGIDTSRNKQRLHGLAAITTTQKFGRNSPAAVSNTRTTPLKAITTGNKETENNDITNDVISKTVTSRITRRGSVKEMSKKFIENAVESVQTERKSSYPKAGLILRTSSFKEQIAGSDFDSRASTPGMNEFSKTISLESMESANESKTTRRTDSKTFLNSQTRVTGVQDVISRMKNSTNDSEPGECADDAEARALLNKFLGAQVLMTGMESMMGKQQQSTTVERRSIVTSSKSTSKQESNTPQVSSSISHFTRPVTLADIENIWDESILRLLLTTSTSYEERRIIRARLRQVMAEQEACANIVASMVAETKATELSGMDGTTNTTSTTNRHSIQGESLLLPLLKELLDKQQQQPQNISVAPQNTTTILRTNSSQSSDESGQTSTAIEDSGTESGEDLRLLAAGICDSIEQQRTQNDNRPTTTAEPLGPGLLSEVLSALNRLQTSLQSDSQEVIDPTRKLGLLQLVTRLQASLVPTTVLPPVTTEVKPVEKSSNQSRFAKRKDRKNRHTVGVSSEELADARRLMEEMVLRDTLTNAHTPEDIATPPEFGYAIQKQKSDGSVIPPLSGSNLIKPQYKPVSFNTSAKPFQSESSYAPNVTTSEDPYQNHEFPPPIEPLPPSYQIGPPASSIEYNESKNISDEKAQVIQEIQKAALVKQTSLLSEQNEDETFETKLDDDEPPIDNYTTQDHHHEPEINEDVSSVQRLLHIAQDIPNKPLNRFNNKKLRMKRANTIDIPKPINFYQNDDDSDSSIPEYDGKDSATIRKNNYLALRGPIRVSNNASKNTIVPSFEAKTENDKKFLAFIKKHENDTNNHKVTSWMGGINNTQDHSAQPKNHYLQAQNWNNAFGNIKTIFENNSDNSRSSSTTSNSARKFWQTTDDFAMNKKNFHQQVNNNQKPINNTQNIKNLFEQKQEQPKLPWTATNHQEVITGSVKIDPHATSGDQLSVTNVSQRYIPKPIPVNKFSHAPMSAFKPIPKRAPQPVQQPPPPKTPQFSPPVNVTPPRYVTPGTAQSWTYSSPKPVSPSNNDSHAEYNQNIKSKIPELAEQFIHPHSKSPTNIVPWAVNSNPNEKRVLALAASKFEQPKIHLRQDEPPKVIHREKVYVPPIIKDVMSGPTTHIDKRYSMHEVPYYEENLTSPKLVQKFEHNKPRKLSEDYQDNNSTNLLKSYNYQPNNEFNNSFEPIQYQTKTQPIYQHQNGVNYDLDTDDYSQEVANIQMKNEPQNYYETKPPASDSQVNTQANSQEPLKIFDFPSPEPEPEKPNEPEISENSDLTSLSMTEYKAVSKVMKGPVAQSAVTVSQNTPKRREEEMQMANNLKSSLQNFKKQDDNLDQKSKQPTTQSKIEKISSPKTHRRSLSNERHKRSNSIGRKLDRQDSKEKKKEKVQNYIKREEKIVKPNVQLTTATFKKLNERGLPYEEPKIQGSAFRRLSADSVIKKDNEIHKMYENPLYSPTTTRSNNMFAAKYEFQKPAPPKVQPKESQSKPSYHINPIPKYTPKQEPQTNKLFQENKSVPTYPSNQPIQTRPQNNQTRPYPDKNYVGYSSQCVVSNKQYNVPPAEPVRPTLASTNQRQLSTESIEYNEQGESVVTSKLQIPVTKDKFLPQLIPIDKSQPPKIPSPTNLHHHRSDVSWQHIPQHQIPLNKPPSPRGSPRSRYLLQKAKSSHNLAVPTKQFEAGITKDELVQKKKTVEAYFSSSKSPNTLTKTSSQTSMIEKKPTNHSTINRSRMSERISTQSNNFSGGMALSRSRTMPQVVFSDIPLLDEKQVETTKKTVQEGPTTTTEVTTTRITTQRSKPVSPFQKFRQLDKQNSLSSSSSAPNSPMTPGGAGGQPLFKFTDPTLRNSASTVKDRLLYWCQVKTKEYKNVQIENFSTSWADGLAFCALIHHFRPDAFDYDALTPQQRRHNFALAFRVADEIAGIAPLLDVEDMVMMRKPDWKCVFTYVQSIYRRFKDEEI